VAADHEVELTLTVERGERGEHEAVVVIGGELEFGTAGPLRTALADLSRSDADPLVLDLAGVEFIDSTGVSLLVQAKQRFEAQGRTFVLRSPAHRVMRVLEVAGLADIFVIE
jgi:anti-anti-sigma factor